MKKKIKKFLKRTTNIERIIEYDEFLAFLNLKEEENVLEVNHSVSTFCRSSEIDFPIVVTSTIIEEEESEEGD